MRKKIHLLLWLSGSALALLVLLLVFVRTDILRNQIRSRIVSALAEVTGGRVEVAALDVHWRTLSVEIHNLTIHGTEAAGSPPLLQVRLARVGLKLTSLLAARFRIDSLVAERPQLYVLLRPDGSTNLPEPHLDPEQALTALHDLRLERFDISHGTVYLNAQRYPLELHGKNLAAQLAYSAARQAYSLDLSADEVAAGSSCCEVLPLNLQVKGTLGKNRLLLSRLALATGNSKLEATGTISHFNRPQVDLQYHGELGAREMAAVRQLEGLTQGRIAFEGEAHLHAQDGWVAEGKLRADKLVYRSPAVTLQELNVTSAFHATKEDVTLRDVVAAAPVAKFTGTAELFKWRKLKLDGRVARLSLGQAAAAAHRAIPFSGLAEGPVTLTADLPISRAKLAWRTALRIAASRGAMPLSGNIELEKAADADWRVTRSHLALPATQFSFQGSPDTKLRGRIDSTNLMEVLPVLAFFHASSAAAHLARLLPGGAAHFEGSILHSTSKPMLDGALTLSNFEAYGRPWGELRYQGTLTKTKLDIASLQVTSTFLHVAGSGQVELRNWQITRDSRFHLRGKFQDANIAQLHVPALRLAQGLASGSLDLSGTIQEPAGSVQMDVMDPAYGGQRFRRLTIAAFGSPTAVHLSRGSLTGSQGGALAFSGEYQPSSPGDWHDGRLAATIHSAGFPLHSADLKTVAALDLKLAARVENAVLQPLSADGNLALSKLSAEGLELGSMRAKVSTAGQALQLALEGDLRDTQFHGEAQVSLTAGSPTKGTLRFGRLNLATLSTLLHPTHIHALPAQGFLAGTMDFTGPLLEPSQWRSTARVDRLAITSTVAHSTMELHNQQPLVFELAAGRAQIRSFQLAGKDTLLNIGGSFGYLGPRTLDLTANGSADLQLLRLFDPNLQAAGHSQLRGSIKGTLAKPLLEGRLAIENASFTFENYANGLSAVNGRVAFTNDRATIESLSAVSGGGQLKLGGFVSYGGAGPLVYHLDARGSSVRLRYGSISVTANTDLRLTGTSTSSLLSGSATVSRVVFNTNTDVGNVLTNFAAPTPANRQDFFTGLHLDVGIESTPDLELATALSRDVEASIDLHLRGTPDHPVLLGSVSANQGDIRAFGSRYTLNRGEVTFVNTNRIDPVLDLDLQTRARGITVNITISGALNHLNISYRSDPPLQPRDIIALLTVGRTPQEASNVQTTQTSLDANALQASTSSVLGQAMTPASGRLSKLFGVTNIKLDPLVQGITANTQSRLTLEQQMSRSITVTYITNLEQTSEQIFRVEWAINQQYSVVAVRDDNGEFGIDFQYKKRFK